MSIIKAAIIQTEPVYYDLQGSMKKALDVTGHYARLDVFDLTVNRKRR